MRTTITKYCTIEYSGLKDDPLHFFKMADSGVSCACENQKVFFLVFFKTFSLLILLFRNLAIVSPVTNVNCGSTMFVVVIWWHQLKANLTSAINATVV